MASVYSLQISLENIFSQAWEIIIAAISILAGVTGLILFYDWIRPKVKNIRTTATYIDYEANKMIEEKEMEITWAYFSIFKSISLPRIPRNAEYQIDYKARIKPKAKLNPDYYAVSEAGKFRKIKLVNKKFCDEEDVEFVYITYRIIQNDDYRQKISEKRENNKIVILNANLTEIRNYRVQFPPKKVTAEKANMYFGIAERFETDQSSSNEATIAALVLKPIAPCQSVAPGRVEIPL